MNLNIIYITTTLEISVSGNKYQPKGRPNVSLVWLGAKDHSKSLA